jgi:hypothetical protein
VACNQFCEKGVNPFDLVLERHEETGALNVLEENTTLFRKVAGGAGLDNLHVIELVERALAVDKAS